MQPCSATPRLTPRGTDALRQPFPTGAGACLAYEGKTTCCSNATLEAIEHAFDTARTVIEEVRRALAFVVHPPNSRLFPRPLRPAH